MMKFEYEDWLKLLSNNAIPGDLKIECINKYLAMGKDVRAQLVILNEFKEILDKHTKHRGCDHFAYRWLENYYPFLKEDPNSISNKTNWEDKIEIPLINLFEKLEIKFCYQNSLEHKKAVIEKYENWDILFHDDCFIKVLDFVIEKINKLSSRKALHVNSRETNSSPKHNQTFNFKGDPEDLKTIINQLCLKADLIKEEICSQADILNVLRAKDWATISTQIHLNCETASFCYIVEKLKPLFGNLKLIAIEKSGIFYSKKGNLIKAQNLSSSRIDNPKLKEEIDRIFK